MRKSLRFIVGVLSFAVIVTICSEWVVAEEAIDLSGDRALSDFEIYQLEQIKDPSVARDVLEQLLSSGILVEKETLLGLQRVAGGNEELLEVEDEEFLTRESELSEPLSLEHSAKQAEICSAATASNSNIRKCVDNTHGGTLDKCIIREAGNQCDLGQRKCCDWERVAGRPVKYACKCNTSVDGPCHTRPDGDVICAACMGIAEGEGEPDNCLKMMLCTFKRRQQATGDDTFCKTATRKGGNSGNGSWYTSDKCSCDRTNQHEDSKNNYNQKYCDCSEAICSGGNKLPGGTLFERLVELWRDPNLCTGVAEGLDSYKVVPRSLRCPPWLGAEGVRCGSHCYYDLKIRDERHDPITY